MTVSQYQRLTPQEVEDIATELAAFEEYKPDPQEMHEVLVARSTIARFRVHNLIETIRALHLASDTQHSE